MPPHIRPQSTVDAGLLLSDAHVLDWQIAQICGVTVKTVRRWRRLCQRRGMVRGGAPPMPPCFICDEGSLDVGAYSYLLGLYLGDGHIVRNKRGINVLSIFQDNAYLRGLFSSDSCLIINWTEKSIAGERKRYEYPRYFFSNRSEDILGLCTWALDLLSISWRRSSRWHISVARREAVAALDEFVGPKY